MIRSFLARLDRPRAPRRDVEQLAVIPVEVPVITETKRLWLRGDRTQAILFAYPAALADLQRAYDLAFDPTWTHEEIHTLGMRQEMGHLPEFFRRLYRLYEPVRYGADGATPTENPVGILLSIYGHSPMWRLYAETVTRGRRRSRVRRVPTPSAGTTAGGSGA